MDVTSLTRFAATAAALALLVGFAPAASARGPAPTLDPARLVSVVVGVLEWREPGLPSFSKKNRKDVELDALLGARGVPAARRTLLIDEAATARAVKAALTRAIAATRPGDTLLFYFTGHGIKHGDGKIIFATTDTRARVKSGLHLDELSALFGGRRFSGARVLLLADACHSGGLAQLAGALARLGVEVVALTSAEVSNVSTGNWTFTQAVIDCLSGSPLCDVDGDGRVTLGELRHEARDTMLHREQQQIGWVSHGVSAELVLAQTRHDDPALAPGQPRRGEWVSLAHRGEERVGRVLGARGDALLVSLYSYSDEERVTVAAAATRPLVYASWPVGADLTVLWNRAPYHARVVKVDGWLHFVTYPGWDAVWDEWVGPERIVGAFGGASAGNTGRPPSGFAEAPRVAAGEGGAERLEVEWRGNWYEAVRTGEREGRVCIHYVGWGSEWDECVAPTRVRAAR